MPALENQNDNDQHSEDRLKWNYDIQEWAKMKARLRIVNGESHRAPKIPNLV